MSQRVALIVSVALTAFVLVLTGAVVGRVSQANEPPAEADVAEAPVDAAAVQPETSAESVVTTEAQLYLEREAAYRELVSQANQRLQAAYDQLQMQAAVPAMPEYISPEQATALAMQAAPGLALLRAPVLVDYQGIPAYEILLAGGYIYIDAQTGQVLFNGIQQAVVAPGSSNGGSIQTRMESRPGHDQAPAEHEDENESEDENETENDD